MKKMIFVKFAVLVCMLGISAIPAFAEEKDQKLNYVKVNLGAYQPTGKLDDNNYDTGASFSLSYSRYLTPYLSLAVGLDFFGIENDYSGSTSAAGTYDQENIMTGHGITFTVKGEYPRGPVRMYIGGGFGIYAAVLSTEINSSILGDIDKTESDFIASGHILTGLDISINDRWFVNIEGKYSITEDVDISKTVASVPVTYKGDMDGYSVTAGLGFRF